MYVNGAGNSTFLRALQGQLPLSGGTIKVHRNKETKP